jgi:protein-S-isoprenylcysteine O-methyltransferase Ste14
LSAPERTAGSSFWLAFRSLLWTILLPGLFAGFLPWRYFGLSQVGIDWRSPRQLLGLATIGIGVVLLGACIWEFARRGKGTLAPLDPPTELVVQGLYRYVRNPMYLSVTAIVLGEALLIGSKTLLEYWAVWFVTANLFVIWYEEPALRRRFGPAYERYQAAVGRWLPRRSSPGMPG